MAKKGEQGRPTFKTGENMKNYTIGLYPSMMGEIQDKCVELNWNPTHHRSRFIRNAVRYYIDVKAYKEDKEIKENTVEMPTVSELYRLSELIEESMIFDELTVRGYIEKFDIRIEMYDLSEDDDSKNILILRGVFKLLEPIHGEFLGSEEFRDIWQKIYNTTRSREINK